ncbi:MAG: hypothetical protein A2413_01985 [Treponema sp. RIFOXYC1_FULL_61_9]|nr:MAG: hypothetical protein A2Y36_04685 [Treponema sp. GWA1_62_8]OHE69453.1 MAG: hypothetical protein A2001_18885 [Treponema sp. GWC1_61_84]OHE71640.1 MAG: hypothetical protein A2413_01985 [Treponema sp. RIFOXYC1_FULL_61_9]
MKLRTRFILLFASQALIVALASVAFTYRSMGTEYARAESESGFSSARADEAARATRDGALGEEERLRIAVHALDELRAAEAAGRLYRSQAAVESIAAIGVFSLIAAFVSASFFSLAARPLSRRLDDLVSLSARAGADRSFRFPPLADKEFGPVHLAFDKLLDTIIEQEKRLAEASRLEGWKEVSSFLFHQLRAPLSVLELSARNAKTAIGRIPEGALPAEEALRLCSDGAEAAEAECLRIRALLDRFKELSGLVLVPAERTDPRELVRSCAARLIPGKANISFPVDAGFDLIVDRRLMEEAIMNIVMNSIEACAAPPASIRFETTRSVRGLELTVRDGNGPVDPSLIARLGRERFSTKREGTGLGLLFVRRALVLHEGIFEILPPGDGGFGVRLVLPPARLIPREKADS